MGWKFDEMVQKSDCSIFMFLLKDVNLIQTTVCIIIILIVLMIHCSKEHTLMILDWTVQGRKVWKRKAIGQLGGKAPLDLNTYINIPKVLMLIIIICIMNAIRWGMPCYVFHYCQSCLRYVIQAIFDVSMPLGSYSSQLIVHRNITWT